jgi:hypothetical protein
MPDFDSLLRPPYVFLTIGVFFFSMAVVGTCTGKIVARVGRVVYRAEEPNQFWWGVAIYSLAGIWFIGDFLYHLGVFGQ